MIAMDIDEMLFVFPLGLRYESFYMARRARTDDNLECLNLFCTPSKMSD